MQILDLRLEYLGVGVLIQGNNLWVRGRHIRDSLQYDNLAHDMDVRLAAELWRSIGDLITTVADLYLVMVTSPPIATDYWYDFSKIAGGIPLFISDPPIGPR